VHAALDAPTTISLVTCDYRRRRSSEISGPARDSTVVRCATDGKDLASLGPFSRIADRHGRQAAASFWN